MSNSFNPPTGWYPFGIHGSWETGTIPPLEFSKEVDEDDMPLWERPLWTQPDKVATYLLETDALTPTDSETLHPQSYIVDSENIVYLVTTVMQIAGMVERHE